MNEHKKFITEFRLGPRRVLVRSETKVTIKNKRGRWTFMYARETDHGVELTFYGGIASQGQFASVRPDSVKQFKRNKRRRTVSQRGCA